MPKQLTLWPWEAEKEDLFTWWVIKWVSSAMKLRESSPRTEEKRTIRSSSHNLKRSIFHNECPNSDSWKIFSQRGRLCQGIRKTTFFLMPAAVTFSRCNHAMADSRIFIIPLTPSHSLSSGGHHAQFQLPFAHCSSILGWDSDSSSAFSDSRETMPTWASSDPAITQRYALFGTWTHHFELNWVLYHHPAQFVLLRGPT